MKVLFIQKMGGIAGSELYHLKIIPALLKKGIACEFVSVFKAEDKDKNKVFNQLLADSGVKVHEIQIRQVLSLSLLRKIDSIFRKGGFTVLHTHLVHADFWGSLVKFALNPKMVLVSTKHGYDESFQAKHGLNPDIKVRDLYYWLERFSEKMTTRSACISAGLRNLFIANGISQPQKIDLIPYGFNFLSVQYDKTGRQFRYSPKQLVIVGRLIPFKGHQFVLQILPELVQEVPEICLVIVGSGPCEQELKEQVQKLGMEKHVRFEGYQSAIHDYLRHSDVCVIPSTSEGFCAVILEAWHNSKPIVAFDVPAPNTIIRNNESGLLVKPFDTAELKEKLAYLLNNPNTAKRIGANGYRTLKKEFALNNMVEETIRFYKRALKQAKV